MAHTRERVGVSISIGARPGSASIPGFPWKRLPCQPRWSCRTCSWGCAERDDARGGARRARASTRAGHRRAADPDARARLGADSGSRVRPQPLPAGCQYRSRRRGHIPWQWPRLRLIQRCRRAARDARSASREQAPAGGSICAGARRAVTWGAATTHLRSTRARTSERADTRSCRASSPKRIGSSTSEPTISFAARSCSLQRAIPPISRFRGPPAWCHPTGSASSTEAPASARV
jgi:hypothetical protein